MQRCARFREWFLLRQQILLILRLFLTFKIPQLQMKGSVVSALQAKGMADHNVIRLVIVLVYMTAQQVQTCLTIWLMAWTLQALLRPVLNTAAKSAVAVFTVIILQMAAMSHFTCNMVCLVKATLNRLHRTMQVLAQVFLARKSKRWRLRAFFLPPMVAVSMQKMEQQYLKQRRLQISNTAMSAMLLDQFPMRPVLPE